jgi:DNA-binding CsgD family transcriptional regulator
VTDDRGTGPIDRRLHRSPPLLVGRAGEQVFLREELATALGGHGRLVLLGGEAGIGKTSLARDLAWEAHERRASVLTGSCYDLTNTPPYGPWLDLFEGYQPESDLPPAPPTFAGGRLESVTDQAALFAEVRRFFAALGAVRPAVVLLEDLHWADPASLELLRSVAPQLGRWPILLLVTYRGDEPTQRDAFYQQLPTLIRESEGFRLDLRPLDAGGLHSLVAARCRLSAPDEDRLVHYLGRHAEGNPFFATELLRALEDGAVLRQTGDDWSLAELDRVVVPPLLRQVIDGRVAHLGDETRQPLAVAAVIGQEVPLALWSEVAELDEETLLGIVEQAVAAHLLEAERDGTRVRFVHALTREALYEGILPPRRRLWHRRVAESLMANAQADPDAVAFHLQEAGDPHAWEWLVKAGDRAQRAYAMLTAAERLRAAMTLLEGVVGEERTCCRLACRIGYLKRFSDPAGAIADVEAAERAAARIGDTIIADELRWLRGALLGYSDRFRAGCADMQTSLAAFEVTPLDDAEALWGDPGWFGLGLPAVGIVDPSHDELTIAKLHAAGLHFRQGNVVWFRGLAGTLDTAIGTGERIVALADVPGAWGNIPAAAFTYQGLGIAHAALGRPGDAHRVWTRARELFAALDHHALIAFTLLDELRNVALTSGATDPAARRRLSAEAEAALARAGGALCPGVSPRLAWLGCLVVDGRWDEADQILRDLPHPGNCYLRREMTAAQVLLARHRGHLQAAWARVDDLLPDGPATEPGDIIHQEGLFLQRLAADLCLDAGDLPGAHAWLTAHDAWLAWSGSVLGRADGRLAWARYHRAAGDTELARSATTGALAESPPQPLVHLGAHRLLGEIDTEAGDHGAADAHLQTAFELAAACEAPFERALTSLAFAELRLSTGSTEDAATHLADVRRICAPLGATPTLRRAESLAVRLPARALDGAYPAGLTQRELDVLRLLAQRLSNPEIAEALFVGPRTVQTHVEHIFAKLGVNNRRDAAEAAARFGLV